MMRHPGTGNLSSAAVLHLSQAVPADTVAECQSVALDGVRRHQKKRRGICADIVGSLKEGVGEVYPTRQKWKPETAKDLRRLCTAIHRLAVGTPAEENLVALSTVLENLSQALPNYSFASRSNVYRKLGEIAEMPSRIAEILDDYDRSTINLSLPRSFKP